MIRHVLIAVVRGYQLLLRPLLPPACRFHPTCSEYAVQAIEHRGPTRGALLALGRILRCHPWHPGGYDPIDGAAPERMPCVLMRSRF